MKLYRGDFTWLRFLDLPSMAGFDFSMIKGVIRTVLPEEVGGKKLILQFKKGTLHVLSKERRVLAHAQGSITERDVVFATTCPDHVGTRWRLLDVTLDSLAKLHR